jgi:hypothetical protein
MRCIAQMSYPLALALAVRLAFAGPTPDAAAPRLVSDIDLSVTLDGESRDLVLEARGKDSSGTWTSRSEKAQRHGSCVSGNGASFLIGPGSIHGVPLLTLT